jgi:ankyrin repeat protein
MNLNRLFIEALKLDMLPVIRKLVEAGVDARFYNDASLRWAAQHGRLETVKYLVSIGCDPRSSDDCALRWAA